MIESLIFGLIVFAVITSTYITYTSILGHPKEGVPKKGLYLKHHIDEPNWIYLWVLSKDNIPMGYKIVYSREVHNSLLGVQGKAEEGKFMILGDDEVANGDLDGEEYGEESRGGFTVGGDISFYEWDYFAAMPPKD